MKEGDLFRVELHIARDDIMLGLNRVFHQRKEEIEHVIEKVFETANIEVMIRDQVEDAIKDIIRSAVRECAHGEMSKLQQIVYLNMEKSLDELDVITSNREENKQCQTK